jgi:hypothetical protein
MVIFAAKEVSPEWSLGIDVFAEWDTEDELNIGPGVRHPAACFFRREGYSPEGGPSSIRGAAADCHLGSLGRLRALLHPSPAPAPRLIVVWGGDRKR